MTHHKINQQFSFKFSFNINDLKEDWICVKHQNTYLSLDYLHALENSKLPNLKFIYAILYQNYLPVGIVYFQHLKITHHIFKQEKFPSKTVSKWAANALTILGQNILLCGNFFATGTHGYALNKGIASKLLLMLVTQLKQHLKKDFKTLKVNFVMFKDFYKKSDISLQATIKNRHALFEIDVNMLLYIKPYWNNFDTYLNNMKTKYRTKAKSTYKKTSKIITKDLNAEDIWMHQKSIQNLYLSVVNTSGFYLAKLSAQSFYQLKLALQDAFVFTGYFLKDELVAFSSACIGKRDIDASYVGINYKVNKAMPIYQRILYDYVQLSIAKKASKLYLGRTAETMKSSLGAVPLNMNLYIKHTQPIAHALLRPILNYVKPSEYQTRNPFKNDAPTSLQPVLEKEFFIEKSITN